MKKMDTISFVNNFKFNNMLRLWQSQKYHWFATY